MRDPDLFDAFYKEARGRLLLQTYALTGDLAASRAAVRDAFIMAWHHWRKVSRLEDPEESVRPHAWQHAQRRHTARIWHREKGVAPEVHDTLDALAKLPAQRRRALLLVTLAHTSIPQMAREIGLPPDDAERELQAAAADFTAALGITAADIRDPLEPLESVVAGARWPRSTIIRRAGAARRRTHTAIGAAVAVTALVVSGTVVTDGAGAHPRLDRMTTAPAATPDPDDARVDPLEAPADDPAAEPEMSLTAGVLVGQAQLRNATGRKAWNTTSTVANDEVSAQSVPCQQERYADPRGEAALARTFRAKPVKGRDLPTLDAVQTAELSRGVPAARRAFGTALGWYSGCLAERMQLISLHRVFSVGDQAMLVTLRSWKRPVTTMTIGLARTGGFTTTTATSVGNERQPDLEANAGLLAAAVSRLCTLPEGGDCSGGPRLRRIPPLAVGDAPALLSELDLPPVSGVRKPWVGTEPRKAKTNAAATRCDGASFDGTFQKAPFKDSATRTFLIPEADLPAEFGLTETAATLPPRRARAFVADVKRRLARCEDDDEGLGTRVEMIADRDDGSMSLTAWQLTVDVSDERAVRFTMAVLRRGSAVAQLTFVPAPRVAMSQPAFLDLAYRAQERLVELPRRKSR